MTARTTDPLIPPVTEQDLADFIVGDASDPAITGILIAATSAVIRYIGYDLTPREWVLTCWDWPVSGTQSRPELSRGNYSLDRLIRLPYAGLVSVESVEIYGEATTSFIAREDAIVLPDGAQSQAYNNNAAPALVVKYTAGFDPVPGAIKQAIIMAAAFMYEHRGDCDADQALNRSGARELLGGFVSPEKLAAA